MLWCSFSMSDGTESEVREDVYSFPFFGPTFPLPHIVVACVRRGALCVCVCVCVCVLVIEWSYVVVVSFVGRCSVEINVCVDFHYYCWSQGGVPTKDLLWPQAWCVCGVW